MPTGYLILGDSAAGIAAAEAIRKLDKTTSLTIVSAENVPAYARCLLPELIAGRFSPADLSWREKNFYSRNNIELILGNPAVKINPDSHTVELADGTRLGYKRLLLATGARNTPLPVPGEELALPLRTIAGARKIAEEAKKAREAVVIGAGPVGLKAAVALKALGVQATVIEEKASIMTAVLEEESAGILQDFLQREGLRFFTGQQVKSIEKENGPRQSRVKKVELANGRILSVDLVIYAAGITPNKELAAKAGVKVELGITVDRRQQTNQLDIYAAGDVCQVEDELTGRPVIPGRWDTAVEQGKVAGWNMAGKKRTGSNYILMHAGQHGPLSVVALGLGNKKPGGGYSTYTYSQPEKGLYRRLVFQNKRLVGAIFLGDVSRAGIFAALIKSKREVEDEAQEMLKGRPPVLLSPAMLSMAGNLSKA